MCLEDIVTQHITVALTCTHKSAFHERCINIWLKERFKYPVCRTRGKLYYFPKFLQNDIIETSPVFNEESTINIVVMHTCEDLSYSTQREDNYTNILKNTIKSQVYNFIVIVSRPGVCHTSFVNTSALFNDYT